MTEDMIVPNAGRLEQIVAVGPELIGGYRELRLRGLQEHPEAFGETAAAFKATSDAELVARIENQTKLGGFILAALSQSGEMQGVIGLALNNGEKTRHRGLLWGMYVKPESRGAGIARKLVEELLVRVERIEKLDQIHLSVVTSNESAVALYRKMGFVTYGTDPRVLKVGDAAFNEYLMVRILNQ